jgi:hypothetical protein
MHTMQHFHSYQRWNERLFEEMYDAYYSGRSKKDPSLDWYEGEIWFFDNCVIPLSERIKDSGVFGVQGDDCLKNAISNKKEWAVKGGDIVRDQVTKILRKKEILAEAAKSEEKKAEEKDKEPGDKKEKEKDKEKAQEKDKHLVEWNVDLFKRMLRQILGHRMAEGVETKEGMLSIAHAMKEGSTVRDEICKIIDFPLFDKKASKLKVDPETIELSKAVEDQLRDYLSFIACMYRDNPFHNFKHASNVSMAANKYLQRVVHGTLTKQVSHPLVQFAVIFASLIHDVDHAGVTNAQLVKEKQRVAIVYNNKSVAEQNSIDVAWGLLMDPAYDDLRRCIYTNDREGQRFRQLLVNSVMATDIFDPDLKKMRNDRWTQAFAPNAGDEVFDLKATIVIEHIIQASDVAHTMQHWHVYQKWNQRFFEEQYKAFNAGRMDKDPSEGWYRGELWFYDNYIIPLAKKLKDCSVFGVASDEFLSYAMDNRNEWEAKGEKIVVDMKSRVCTELQRQSKKVGFEDQEDATTK